MIIVKALVYVCLIVCFAIYIHFEKLKGYRKGFSDGVEQYSKTLEEVLQYINQWNKEAADSGMSLRAYIESIKLLDKSEKEGDSNE